MITKLVNVKLKKSLAERIKDFVCKVHEYWRGFEQSLIDYIMS